MVAIILGAMKSINLFHGKAMPDDSLAKVAQYLEWNITNPKLALLTLRPVIGAKIVYLVCSFFLCIDTLLRIISCPKKEMLFKHNFNFGEILHFFGFILTESIFTSGTIKVESGISAVWTFIVLQTMNALKVTKLFRLGLNIPSVKLMQASILSSYRELLFLFMIVLTFTSLLGPLAFKSNSPRIAISTTSLRHSGGQPLP